MTVSQLRAVITMDIVTLHKTNTLYEKSDKRMLT